MKVVPKQFLPADLTQVKRAREFKRFSLFGFRFGPSKVKELAIEHIVGKHGPILVAKVLVDNKWQTLSESATDKIAARHIDLYVDFRERLAAGATKPAPVAPQAPRRTNAQIYRRSVSAPVVGLQRRNAQRRSLSALEATAGQTPAKMAQLSRSPSIASLRAQIETWDDDFVSASSLSSLASTSVGTPSTAPTTPTASSSVTSVSASVDAQKKFAPYVNAYLADMRRPDAYGTNLEIVALREVLGVDFEVLNGRQVAKDSWQWEKLSIDAKASPAGERSDRRTLSLIYYGPKIGSTDTTESHFVPPKLLGLEKGEKVFADLQGPLSDAMVRANSGEAKNDGSCLFDAIAQQVEGFTAAQLREQAVTWLAAHAYDSDAGYFQLAEEMKEAANTNGRVRALVGASVAA